MRLADTAPTLTEAITPYLPFFGVVAGAILVGAFAVWNRRRGAVETRAPDVNEMWAKQERDARTLDAERAHRRHLENLLDTVLGSFRAYVRRVRHGGSTDLTDRERSAHDAEIPPMPKDLSP